MNSFFWEENHTRIYIGLHLTSRFWWFWCLCWEIFHHEGEWSLFLHIYSRLHICTYLYVFKATVCYDKEMCAESTFFLYEATSRLPAWRWIIFFGKCSHQNNGPRIVCLHHPKIIWKETKYPNIAAFLCLSVFQKSEKFKYYLWMRKRVLLTPFSTGNSLNQHQRHTSCQSRLHKIVF